MIADVGDAEPVQQHRDRVHQHRRVVGDDLQRRARNRAGSSAAYTATVVSPERPLRAQPVVRREQRGDTIVPATDCVDRGGDRRVGGGRVAVRPVVGREVGPGELVERCVRAQTARFSSVRRSLRRPGFTVIRRS